MKVMIFSKVNSSADIPPFYKHKIAITIANSGFTANGMDIKLDQGKQLNLQNTPLLVTGHVTNATPGTIFYYYQKD